MRLLKLFKGPSKKAANPLESRFTEVYDKALWGDDETRSGWGSKRESGHVQAVVEYLREIVPKYNIKSIADIPCGDFNWQPLFLSECKNIDYVGYDIVKTMVDDNKRKYPEYAFEQLDITKQMPHAIGNMRASGATWLLASNNSGRPNSPLPDAPGGSRFLDVTSSPFRYPAPLWDLAGYMCLWRLADLVEPGT